MDFEFSKEENKTFFTKEKEACRIYPQAP